MSHGLDIVRNGVKEGRCRNVTVEIKGFLRRFRASRSCWCVGPSPSRPGGWVRGLRSCYVGGGPCCSGLVLFVRIGGLIFTIPRLFLLCLGFCKTQSSVFKSFYVFSKVLSGIPHF